MQAFKGDRRQWNELLLSFPEAHILQTFEWGDSKIRNGWTPQNFIWQDEEAKTEACVMILQREISFGFFKLRVLYAPKGPVFDWKDESLATRVLNDLQTFAQSKRAIFLKIDPDIPLGYGIPGDDGAVECDYGHAMLAQLKARGWLYSQDQIQFKNTVFIDLKADEDVLLAAMKQKTRYNIRLANRRGVAIRQGVLEDLPMLYHMYAHTAVRDDFVIRGVDYYLELWESFIKAEMCHILIAEFEGEPIAALFLMHFNKVSRYLYGMSTDKYRELMPNYLLQWEAIRLSKQLGCEQYDMWGAPDVFDESDPLWGVYRFKEGFNGLTTRHIGAWDYPNKPFLYTLYTHVLPKLLDLMRNRGKRSNRETIGC